jgi:hypothetical protein
VSDLFEDKVVLQITALPFDSSSKHSARSGDTCLLSSLALQTGGPDDDWAHTDTLTAIER